MRGNFQVNYENACNGMPQLIMKMRVSTYCELEYISPEPYLF